MKQAYSNPFVFLITSATLLLASCAPSASNFDSTYDGPIETVGIVMEETYNHSQRFQDIAYDQALTGFYGHPYGRSRFDVLERQRVETVLSEHDLVQDGSVDRSEAPRLGELIGAQYVVFIDLTNLSANFVSGSSFQIAGVSLGGSGYRADAQVTLTMVDTETGLIVARSTGQANEVIGDAVSVMGASAQLGDEESALLNVLPQAIENALNDLFRTLNS